MMTDSSVCILDMRLYWVIMMMTMKKKVMIGRSPYIRTRLRRIMMTMTMKRKTRTAGGNSYIEHEIGRGYDDNDKEENDNG
jgi:hypothetical protein